ncbi:uncharacterized protein [Parasteatoda tepidariorum]|uniref:uncharacterized protein isoform X2 n=1 Tax=Parasteatoda tepidariorum TaxID=114398 RepID=UPI00077FAC3C|nr:uncharacterized protein LOC107456675 isoform X2 [Parasteatoda tepidariorum]
MAIRFLSSIFIFSVFSFVFFRGCIAAEIRRLSVPRYLQNGTRDAIVMDCDYVYNENDLRLVVKWFFEDSLEPFYQWIPELKLKTTSEFFKNRLDLNYSVNTMDDYSKFRALRIKRPSTDLSGKYTCLVTSLAGQDSREQTMTIYVPAHGFELTYLETRYNTVNVSCEVLGVFPFPNLKLYLRPFSGSPPQIVTDVKYLSFKRPSGSYDVQMKRTFKVSELSSKSATVFECKLELPGTNYAQSKSIAYYPGAPHELSSLSTCIQAGSFFYLTTLIVWIIKSYTFLN